MRRPVTEKMRWARAAVVLVTLAVVVGLLVVVTNRVTAAHRPARVTTAKGGTPSQLRVTLHLGDDFPTAVWTVP